MCSSMEISDDCIGQSWTPIYTHARTQIPHTLFEIVYFQLDIIGGRGLQPRKGFDI